MAVAPPLISPWKMLKHYTYMAFTRYKHMHIGAKLFVWAIILFYISTGVAIIVITPSRIFQFLYDKADEFSRLQHGWIILSIIMIVISFPPLVGHTTVATLCGFAYGLKGFAIAGPASLVGSGLTFVILRRIFSARLHQWSATHEKWQALEAVVKAKGLPLIILIRISPFPPWVWSNSLFASIQPVALWQFLVATCFVFPKIFLAVFIGSKIAKLADGEQRSHMDTQTKILNSAFIVGGLLIAVFAGWWIYRLTQQHIRKLDGFSPAVDELAAEAIEEWDEADPLLGEGAHDTRDSPEHPGSRLQP